MTKCLSTRVFRRNADKSNMSNIDDGGTVWSRKQEAVSVRHAFKQFGSKLNPVLINLNMTVAKGTIYGLLGASGCGKTTLLSCLVGRSKLNSGELWVIGGRPGTKGSGVPGKRVGYMPQELGLCGEFTVKETMMYFGWIFGMKTDEIMERLQFLSKLLDLPSQNRLVKNLSGGQQRRVSFAVALMHDPELLILDEPTVGLDPLLRHSIWNHLVHITKNGQKTVIITTHYIEEARQAHTIGLMRSGRLLAEESPQALLTRYRCGNLEDVFLKLSSNQGNSNEESELNISDLSPVSVNEVSGVVGLNSHQSKEVLLTDSLDGSSLGLNASTPAVGPGLMGIQFCDLSKEMNTSCWSNITSRGKIRALLQKNFLRMWRNVGIMLFIFALPVMQINLFCLAIGRDPNGLNLAIANMEVNGTECNFEPGCDTRRLSCRYLSHLNERILKEHHSDLESAIEAVKNGQAWGAIYFTKNFSRALVARMTRGKRVDDATLDQSAVQVWLDMSNQQVGLLLNRDLQIAYRDFAQGILKDCGKNEKLLIPIKFNEPIYGTSTPRFSDFGAPGVILTVIFFLAVSLTSSSFIAERNGGLLDRSWVAGVSPSEILFSHVITQFVVICGQAPLVLTFMIIVFGVTCNGNIFLVVIITLLQGLCGMCFGFVISLICKLEQDAVPLALGSFYPMLLLSGVIWPIEGMPVTLRYISKCLPATQAINAIRSILTRGWGLDKPEVYLGFISSLSWIVIFMAITLVIFKVKRG